MRLSRVDQELVERFSSMLDPDAGEPRGICHWGQEALWSIPDDLRLGDHCGVCEACWLARRRSHESWRAICDAVTNRIADVRAPTPKTLSVPTYTLQPTLF